MWRGKCKEAHGPSSRKRLRSRLRSVFVSLACLASASSSSTSSQGEPAATTTQSQIPTTQTPCKSEHCEEFDTPSASIRPQISSSLTQGPPSSSIAFDSPKQSASPSEATPRPPTPHTTPIMAAERNLQQTVQHLRTHPTLPYAEAAPLLSKAKISLLQLNALTPTSSTPASLLAIARDVYEYGALSSIRARDPDAFTRYVSQLQPFYELPSFTLQPNIEGRNKVTGLYLLLLLTQGRYAEFHSELEALGTREGNENPDGVEADKYLGYPIRLERWLMEGSYDRVWKAMKRGEVPSEEYGVFSEILTSQIRSEIASSSERAYPSLPLSSTKSLLFLDSEGAVVEFARQRGWVIRDGQIYFPDTEAEEHEEKDISQMVIENTLGYARELETIV